MSYINPDNLYVDCLKYLSDIKLFQGPSGVSATLRKHPNIRTFITQYLKESAFSLDSSIDEYFGK